MCSYNTIVRDIFGLITSTKIACKKSKMLEFIYINSYFLMLIIDFQMKRKKENEKFFFSISDEIKLRLNYFEDEYSFQ